MLFYRAREHCLLNLMLHRLSLYCTNSCFTITVIDIIIAITTSHLIAVE